MNNNFVILHIVLTVCKLSLSALKGPPKDYKCTLKEEMYYIVIFWKAAKVESKAKRCWPGACNGKA